MSDHLAVLVLVFGVPWLLRLGGVLHRGRDSLQLSREALATLRNARLSDAQKERVMRKLSLRMLAQAAILILIGAFAFALPLFAVWLMQQAAWVSLERVLALAMSWPYLCAALVVGILLLRPTRAPRHYSGIDGLLHRFAFATRRAQSASADLENQFFASQLAAVPPAPPVYLTGLPRSGTTFLLEALARLPEFATHTYRDMPFVLTPCLWQRFSAPFQQTGKRRERAHGDGVEIDYDSPEAFEEVLWMTFHPQHYQPRWIEPWGRKTAAGFERFLGDHQTKIRWLRRGTQPSRYLSKNNANIARIAALRRMQPDATILVPFREPLQHALSLQRQHLRFVDIHRRDPFAARYMAGIGHFEFGSQLRPIDFSQWCSQGQPPAADGLDFWLGYWISAYRHLLEQRDALCWIDYDQLCLQPASALEALARRLDLSAASRAHLAAHPIRPAPLRSADPASYDASLLEQARALHRQLQAAAE